MTRKELKAVILITGALAGIITTAITVPVALATNAKIEKVERRYATLTEVKIVTFEPTESKTEVVEPLIVAKPEPQAPTVDPYEAELIGRTIWGEAGGVKSKAERAAVAWCILNRVDAWGISIEEAVTTPYQFQGYRPNGECPQEHIDLAADVLARWEAEKNGAADVGRVLPADYLFFMGDGERNHFSTEYQSTKYWDWSLTDPYKY